MSDHDYNSIKVSILVPVYGVEKYIERCARSLFSQDYKNIEFIFVNDCTRDNSFGILNQVIEEFPIRKQQVRIIDHTTNKGLAGARNTAVENSTGDYLWHIDSDDYIEPGAVSKLVKKACEEKADMVVFDMTSVFADRQKVRRDEIGDTKREYIRRLLHREVVLGVWGKFFARDLFTDYGVKFIEGLNYGEDFVMSPRLAYYSKKIVKLDEPLYNYVQFNAAAYTNNITEKSLNNVFCAVDVLNDFFGNVPDKELYEAYSEMTKLRTKVDMIKVTDTTLRKQIMERYPETRKLEKQLLLQDRLVLCLARSGRWRLLDAFIKYGARIKMALGVK